MQGRGMVIQQLCVVAFMTGWKAKNKLSGRGLSREIAGNICTGLCHDLVLWKACVVPLTQCRKPRGTKVYITTRRGHCMHCVSWSRGQRHAPSLMKE